MNEPDLTFVPTDEMLYELAKRFDDLVFAGTANKTDEDDELRLYWRGSPMACAGLCNYTSQFIFEDYNNNREPAGDG